MNSLPLGFGFQALQALGWALLHSLWIGVIIGVVFSVLRHLFRDQISFRYWLGVVCLFAFASIEIVLFANALLGAVSLPPELLSGRATITALDGVVVAGEMLPNIEAGSMPLTLLISFAWLLGVGVSVWRLMRAQHALRLLAFNAKSDLDLGLERLCAPLLAMLDLRTKVRFAVSELIDVPCVIGLFKPMVILPAALLARMPRDQLELVLLHELSHIKNGDLWINAAQIALEVLMFFHPVVHWISADVRATRERRCDRAVLHVRAAPVRYAHALVSLEEFRHEFRDLALAATGGELNSRVREILASRARVITVHSRPTMHGTVLLSVVATVALTGAISSVFIPHPVPAPAPAAPDKVIEQPALLATLNPQPTPAPVFAEPSLQVLTASAPQRTPIAIAQAKSAAVIARPVLFASRNRLAFRALPKPRLTQIAADELTSTLTEIGSIAVDPSVVQPPKVIARVLPTFALGQKKLQAFALSFSLNSDGVPQRIRLARGQASEKQLLAAQTALAQWRFEPKASAKFVGKRLEQQFSFQELSFGRCKPAVGTRLCR